MAVQAQLGHIPRAQVQNWDAIVGQGDPDNTLATATKLYNLYEIARGTRPGRALSDWWNSRSDKGLDEVREQVEADRWNFPDVDGNVADTGLPDYSIPLEELDPDPTELNRDPVEMWGEDFINFLPGFGGLPEDFDEIGFLEQTQPEEPIGGQIQPYQGTAAQYNRGRYAPPKMNIPRGMTLDAADVEPFEDVTMHGPRSVRPFRYGEVP